MRPIIITLTTAAYCESALFAAFNFSKLPLVLWNGAFFPLENTRLFCNCNRKPTTCLLPLDFSSIMCFSAKSTYCTYEEIFMDIRNNFKILSSHFTRRIWLGKEFLRFAQKRQKRSRLYNGATWASQNSWSTLERCTGKKWYKEERIKHGTAFSTHFRKLNICRIPGRWKPSELVAD